MSIVFLLLCVFYAPLIFTSAAKSIVRNKINLILFCLYFTPEAKMFAYMVVKFLFFWYNI
ncbi:MAG TPA: hypothetical protein DDY77_06890 [Clostridiales bacterium]|nr:hypothetical protein [Clostridiales bacterium]